MFVICPDCKRALTCDDDASCVETVPDHRHCGGGGKVGFVLKYDEPHESEPVPKVLGWKF